MKKSKFIKKVLSSKENTVFVNAEQVENALATLEPGDYIVFVQSVTFGLVRRVDEDTVVVRWDTYMKTSMPPYETSYSGKSWLMSSLNDGSLIIIKADNVLGKFICRIR